MPSALKIGIACYPSFGGSGVVASELARELRRRRHIVHLFSYRLPFKLDADLGGVRYHEVQDPQYPLFEKPSYGMSLASRIVGVARREGLDLIHAHYAYPHSISAILARSILHPRKLPVVTTLHGTDITLVGQAPEFYEMVRYAIDASDRVTCVSRTLRQQTRQRLGISRKISVVPNFVDPLVFRPLRRKPRHRRKVLLHISNLRPVKRVLDALHVAARVNRDLPCTLWIVGTGPDLQEARRAASGIHVRFWGLRRDVARLLARADLLLITSDSESFGLAALEAMACAVPVVSTRCGGVEGLLEERAGRFSDVGDIDGLARQAVQILRDQDLARQLGAEGRRIAVEKYAARDIVVRYEALYRSLIGPDHG